MLKAFPKIFAVGTSYVKEIFNNPVEVTEKLDGSQFVFAKIQGALYFRSKGKEQSVHNADKLFFPPIEHICSVQDRLPEGVVFYSEILNKPKHNTLKYDSTPKNGIAIFGASDVTGTTFVSDHDKLKDLAKGIEVDVVPKLFCGKISSLDELQLLLNKISYLGGAEVEGVVVKNFEQQLLLGNCPIPILCAKLVSEQFKEVHRKTWKAENTGKGKWETFIEGYKTEARWEKAVQHLKESGELENTYADIGKLIKEVQKDITEEEKQIICDFLWREFSGQLLRKSTHGLPEWYKMKIASNAFRTD